MPNENTVSRRSVLRTTAAAGASFSFMGTTTATDSNAQVDGVAREVAESSHSEAVQKYDPETITSDIDGAVHAELASRYADSFTVESALDDGTGRVLETLADHGYLDSPTLSAFDLETTYDDVLDPADDRVGVATTTLDHDGTETAHVMATTRSNGYDIGLYHQPETQNTYALVDTDDGRQVVHDFDGNVGIEADCSSSTYCSDEVCCTCRYSEGTADYKVKKQEDCCLLPDGTYDCDVTDLDCGCSVDPPCCA